MYEFIPFILILLLLAIIVYMDQVNRKERAFHLNLIDRLQNKLMAKDLYDYNQSNKDKSERNVTNPLMKRINKLFNERNRPIEDEDSNDG